MKNHKSILHKPRVEKMRDNEDIRDFMKRVEFALKLEGFSEDYILQYRRETN